MHSSGWVEFELNVTGVSETLLVRVGEFGERSAASVQLGGTVHSGLGATAREALVAALAPLGARVTQATLAAPAMFGASAALLGAV